ncbi:MAG: hypothetical protein NT155_01995 [Candidatus Staskawiczbacteria bacterium]|nr:hypothetical protein [Candidatus Staskawiczbacteria bacterium]
MMEQDQINKIEETIKEFFEKMTIDVSRIEVSLSAIEKRTPEHPGIEAPEKMDVVNLDIKLDEPQILIGQQGQTLFETQRILRAILSRKTGKIFYLNLDINDYKKQKMEYLKDMARELADQVSLTKEEKVLSSMSSYERRVIHSELAQRTDVSTESRGDGQDRYVVIKPR